MPSSQVPFLVAKTQVQICAIALKLYDAPWLKNANTVQRDENGRFASKGSSAVKQDAVQERITSLLNELKKTPEKLLAAEKLIFDSVNPFVQELSDRIGSVLHGFKISSPFADFDFESVKGSVKNATAKIIAAAKYLDNQYSDLIKKLEFADKPKYVQILGRIAASALGTALIVGALTGAHVALAAITGSSLVAPLVSGVSMFSEGLLVDILAQVPIEMGLKQMDEMGIDDPDQRMLLNIVSYICTGLMVSRLGQLSSTKRLFGDIAKKIDQIVDSIAQERIIRESAKPVKEYYNEALKKIVDEGFDLKELNAIRQEMIKDGVSPFKFVSEYSQLSGSEDLILKKIVSRNGYDKLPKVMKQKDIIPDRYRYELFRGMKGTTTNRAEEFTKGAFFQGQGVYGSGTYTTPVEKGKLGVSLRGLYLIKETFPFLKFEVQDIPIADIERGVSYTHQEVLDKIHLSRIAPLNKSKNYALRSDGKTTGQIMRMFLTDDAFVINFTAIPGKGLPPYCNIGENIIGRNRKKAFDGIIESLQPFLSSEKTKTLIQTTKKEIDDIIESTTDILAILLDEGRRAALSGYDAIEVRKGGQGLDEIIVLNRSKVIVQEEGYGDFDLIKSKDRLSRYKLF